MLRTSTLLILTMGIVFAAAVHADQGENRPVVIGYYTAWDKEHYPAEAVDFSILTHLNHAFAWPNDEAGIDMWDGYLYPELIEATHKAGRKICVSLGGWGQCESFPKVAADPDLRALFVKNVMAFIEKHGYDGVDVDWEFPANPEEKASYNLLMRDIRKAGDKRGRPFLLTMAISAGTWSDTQNDYSELNKYVDWYNVMTYDYHGSWTMHAGHLAPMKGVQESVDTTMKFLMEKMGVPAKQVVLGLPFYGRMFTAPYVGAIGSGGDYVMYRDIVKKFDEGWVKKWDDAAQATYLVDPEKKQILTYDTPETTIMKCEYAQKMKFRGVMIWAIGSDYLPDRSEPLLEAIGRAYGK